MIVYHGSDVVVISPDTRHSRKTVDFGQGFYVTPLRDQAQKWSEKFKSRGKNAVVSQYLFNEMAFREMKNRICRYVFARKLLLINI